MSEDLAEEQGKITAFLIGEYAKKDNRQCVRVELLYTPGNGWRDESMGDWTREEPEEAELCEGLAGAEKLASLIMDRAEGDANTKPAGKHRYIVRTRQYIGGRQTHPFWLSPSHGGGGGNDETAVAPVSQGPVRADIVLAGHAHQLLRVNTQMFEGTIRSLSNLVSATQGENSELRAENLGLRREIEELRSNRMQREYEMEMGLHRNARFNAGFQKLMQLGTVVAAKMGGAGDAADASPLGILVGEFRRSLQPPQVAALMKIVAPQMGPLMEILDATQKLLFMEIIKLIVPDEPAEEAAPKGG